MADATSERDIVRAAAEERASVCSCTCYGRSSPRSRAGDDERSGNGGGEASKQRITPGLPIILRTSFMDGAAAITGASYLCF